MSCRRRIVWLLGLVAMAATAGRWMSEADREPLETKKQAVLVCKVVAGGCDEILKASSEGAIYLKNVSRPGKAFRKPRTHR